MRGATPSALSVFCLSLLLAACEGPTGPPGPSVGGYAVHTPELAAALPANESYGTTVALSTGSGTGPITLDFAAHLIVNGTTRLQNGDGSPRSLRCRLVLNPGAGEQVISPTGSVTVATFAEYTMSLAGGVDVEAGTYDVGMQCATLLANPSGAYSHASITVVAIPL